MTRFAQITEITKNMVIIQNKLISEDIFKVQFLCNLKACKGACCWEGDYGAPLEQVEMDTLDKIYEDIKPFLQGTSIQQIEREGKYVYFEEAKEFGTTLLDNGACVYMTFQNGIAKCGIEEAYRAGVTDFKKPISCHLYPIRVSRNETNGFESLEYDEWEICKAACALGEKEQLPMYQFLREAIERKYGTEFYKELEAAGNYLSPSK